MKNELKMETILRIVGIIALIAVIGFSMVACDDGSKDNGGGDVYKLTWGVWTNTTYAYVASQFVAHGVNPTPVGSIAGYITGSDAQNAAIYIETNYRFDDSGERTGSFEDLLNFTKDGIGLPPELKTAMSAQKGNVPVAGTFQTSSNGDTLVVAFYVEKTSSNGGNNPTGPTASQGFIVDGKPGSLTIIGFPSEYNGKNIYGTGNGINKFLACENITVTSTSSITIHYGTIADGSVTLKVWGIQEEAGMTIYYGYGDLSAGKSFNLYDPHMKTLTLTWGNNSTSDVELIVRDMNVGFDNGVGTLDVSSYFE